MAKTHNKKRNVGIIYEQLLRKISCALVEDNKPLAQEVITVLHKHFKPGSQLYREFRLFHALVNTTVDSESLATRILHEAKTAAQNFDRHELEKEKSLLIKDINHILNDAGFYNQRIPEYRAYATTQVLLNDWRKGEKSDFARVSEYEKTVHQRLLREAPIKNDPVAKNEDVNELTVRIMTEKFNKKYGTELNEEQAEIIKEYVFSGQSAASRKKFQGYLGQIKEHTLLELKHFSNTCNNQVLNEKISSINENIDSLSLLKVDDTLISRFLMVSRLKQELREPNNE